MTEKKLFTSIAFGIVVKVIAAFAALLLSLIITRNFSEADAGLFFASYAFLSMIGLMCTFGFSGVFLKYIGIHSSNREWTYVEGLFRFGMKRTLIASSSVALMAYIFNAYLIDYTSLDSRLFASLALTAFGLPAFAAYMLVGYAIQGLHKPIISIFFHKILPPLCTSLLILFYATTTIGLEWAISSLVISSYITLFACLVYWYKNAWQAVQPHMINNQEVVSTSNSIWIIIIGTQLVQWSGQLICALLLSAEDAAHFAIAQRISILTSLPLLAINIVLAPKFAALKEQDDMAALRRISLFASRLLFVIAIPTAVTLFLFAEFLMSLFGPAYGDSYRLLQILAIGQSINIATGSVGFLLNMTGHERQMRNIIVVSAACSLILGPLFAINFGLTGVAVSTAICISIQNLLAVFSVKKKLGFNTLNVFQNSIWK